MPKKNLKGELELDAVLSRRRKPASGLETRTGDPLQTFTGVDATVPTTKIPSVTSIKSAAKIPSATSIKSAAKNPSAGFMQSANPEGSSSATTLIDLDDPDKELIKTRRKLKETRKLRDKWKNVNKEAKKLLRD